MSSSSSPSSSSTAFPRKSSPSSASASKANPASLSAPLLPQFLADGRSSMVRNSSSLSLSVRKSNPLGLWNRSVKTLTCSSALTENKVGGFSNVSQWRSSSDTVTSCAETDCRRGTTKDTPQCNFNFSSSQFDSSEPFPPQLKRPNSGNGNFLRRLSKKVATATLKEAQEFGEMMEHVDEVNFALDRLRKGQPIRIRRASFLSFGICDTPQQRRLLRTQG